MIYSFSFWETPNQNKLTSTLSLQKIEHFILGLWLNIHTSKQKHIFKRNKVINREYLLTLSVIQDLEKSKIVPYKRLSAEA